MEHDRPNGLTGRLPAAAAQLLFPAAVGVRTRVQTVGIGTVVAQFSVPNKTALRKSFL